MERHKIFFSYSQKDASEFALRLYNDLKNAGADVWIDQEDIEPGKRWDLEIEEALKDCQCVLFIMSQQAVASDNVLDEVYCALNEKKQVIPIVYSQCSIPYRVQRLQQINFLKDYSASLRRLLKTLNLDQPPAPPVQPSTKIEVNNKEEGDNRYKKTSEKTLEDNIVSLIILKPSHGEIVSRYSTVKGYVKDDTLEVWLVVHPSKDSGYYVQPKADMYDKGKWEVQMFLGTRDAADVSSNFEICAIANPKLHLEGGEILDSWPSAVYISEVINVIRG